MKFEENDYIELSPSIFEPDAKLGSNTLTKLFQAAATGFLDELTLKSSKSFAACTHELRAKAAAGPFEIYLSAKDRALYRVAFEGKPPVEGNSLFRISSLRIEGGEKMFFDKGWGIKIPALGRGYSVVSFQRGRDALRAVSCAGNVQHLHNMISVVGECLGSVQREAGVGSISAIGTLYPVCHLE